MGDMAVGWIGKEAHYSADMGCFRLEAPPRKA